MTNAELTKTQASKNAIQIIGAETGHTVQNIAFCDTPERAALIVQAVNERDGLIELAAEALWRRDYPQGGSIYKTYESLNFEDKEIYRNEAIAKVGVK
ncbi:MAG: hypothetical protein KGJ90_07230, partial [Patescibacteria group bacterium]|nr:hypothetical protein [Patescibacteria group bacterium]